MPAPRSREVASILLVSMASCLVAVAAMILVGWDTQAGTVRLADSLSAARGASNMATVLLTSVSATILVLAAGRLGWLWSRVTKGEC